MKCYMECLEDWQELPPNGNAVLQPGDICLHEGYLTIDLQIKSTSRHNNSMFNRKRLLGAEGYVYETWSAWDIQQQRVFP